MKKIIAFALAMVMVMALAACSGSGISVNINAGGNTTAAPAAPAGTTAPAAPETTVPAETEAPATTTEPVQVETEPQETLPVPTEPVTTDGLNLGSYSGDKYTNDYLNVGFNLPEGFAFASESEIKEANGLSTGLSGAALNEALQELAAVYVVVAARGDEAFNITAVKNPTMEIDTYLQNVSVEIQNNLSGIGATDMTSETGSANGSTPGVLVTCKYNGQEFYLMTAAYRVDDYLVAVQITTYSLDDLNEILDYVQLP